MNFRVWELEAQAGQVVEVSLRGTEANVQLMDWTNYNNYRSRRAYRYSGGHFRQSPVHISVPYSGRWYLTVDLGGYGGRVDAAVRVI